MININATWSPLFHPNPRVMLLIRTIFPLAPEPSVPLELESFIDVLASTPIADRDPPISSRLKLMAAQMTFHLHIIICVYKNNIKLLLANFFLIMISLVA